MVGWLIFKHSLKMLLRNFGKALHIYAVPWIIGVVAVLVVIFIAGLPLDLTGEGIAAPEDVSAGKLVVVFLSMLVIIILVSLWIAVAWHRYILMEEAPTGILPPIHQDRIAAYLGRGFLLFLAFLVPGVVLVFLLVTLAEVSMTSGIVVGVVLGFALAVLFYRLSVILPAAALGQKMSFSEALEATKGATGPIIVIGLCFLALQILIELALSVVMFIPVIGFVGSILVAMFSTMLGISILTTLYGYYVEKREV